MKKWLALLFAVLVTPAQAQIFASYPYIFQNGTIADATQVNANFNAIASALNAGAAHNGTNSDITYLTALVGFSAYSGTLSGALSVGGTLTAAGLSSFTGVSSFASDILMSGTGEIDIPSGTTAQRSASPNSGMIRYNTTIGQYEGYSGAVNSWVGLQNGGAGFRNRIINGDFRIDQRNNGSAQSITANNSVYTVDRWVVNPGGSGATVQRVAGTVSQYALQITGAGGNTGINVVQRLESTNTYDLAGASATLSAYLADSTLTSITWSVNYAGATDNFNVAGTTFATGTCAVSSTPQLCTATFAVPSAATTGIAVSFYAVGQTSGTFTLQNVQLEPEATLTPFERLPIQTALSSCQRYYYVSPVGNTIANGVYAAFSFKSTMRVAPSITFQGLSGGSVTGLTITTDSFFFQYSAVSGFGYTANAEL